MKVNYLTLLVLSIVFISCQKSKDNSTTEVTTINIPENPISYKGSWEKVSDLEDVVVLETNSQSIIRNVDKIVCENGKFYILDIKQKRILVFDRSGKFMAKLSKTGNGPGEYREIRDFDLDQKGNIYLLDYGRIVVFDRNLKFKEYINLESNKDDRISFIPLHITLTSKNDFYLWQGSFGLRDDNFKNKFALFKVSRSGEIIDNYIPFNHKTVGNQRFFRNFKGDVLVTPIKGNDTIYSIDATEIFPKFFIDFGRKRFNDKSTAADAFLFHSDILESSKYLHFKFSDGEKIYSTIYSKETEKLIIETLSFGNKYNLGPLRCLCEDSFVSAVEGYIVNYTIDEILENVESKSVYDKLLPLKNLERDNNPALFIYKLKGL